MLLFIYTPLFRVMVVLEYIKSRVKCYSTLPSHTKYLKRKKFDLDFYANARFLCPKTQKEKCIHIFFMYAVILR